MVPSPPRCVWPTRVSTSGSRRRQRQQRRQLLDGQQPADTGDYQGPRSIEYFGGEPQRDAALKAEALAYIRAEPLEFLKRTAIKAVRLHERESIGVSWNEPGLTKAATDLLGQLNRPADPWAKRLVLGVKVLSNVWWWLMLALAKIGPLCLAISAQWRLLLFGPATLLWRYFTAGHVATVIQDSYHFAAVPAIAILAATALQRRRAPSH